MGGDGGEVRGREGRGGFLYYLVWFYLGVFSFLFKIKWNRMG